MPCSPHHCVSVVLLLYYTAILQYSHGINQVAHNSLNGFPLWKSITEPKALCLCVRLLSNTKRL